MANKCSVSLTYCLLDTHTVVDTPICACPQAVQCSNWPCPPASLQYKSRVLEQLGWCRFAEHTTTQRVPNVVLLDVGMPTCATALAWRRSAINVAGVEPAQDHKWMGIEATPLPRHGHRGGPDYTMYIHVHVHVQYASKKPFQTLAFKRRLNGSVRALQ